ncbi:MAG: hypothetical protein AB7G44_04310 [Bacteroidia bacterium]
MDYQISNTNYKLVDVPSGIANAAQPYALNITPSRVSEGLTVGSDGMMTVSEALTTGSKALTGVSDEMTVGSEGLMTGSKALRGVSNEMTG